MIEKNIICIESEEMGEFKISLTEEQILVILDTGAEFLIDTKTNYEQANWEMDENEEPIETPPVLDWNLYFPEINNDEIENTMKDQELREEEARMATGNGFVFMSCGLAAIFGASTETNSLNKVRIVYCSGPFFR